MTPNRITDNQYVSVTREFILKVDGNRPLLYSLDYINTHIYWLTPLEGFALSLLDGRQQFSEVRRMFCRFFPQADVETLPRILLSINDRVIQFPSQTGIGNDGALALSDHPLVEAQRFDPRKFIISTRDYEARIADVKTRFRLDTPINIYTVFTNRCFTNCIYCYADRKKVHEMTLARWREIVQEMHTLGIILSSPDNGDTFAREDGIDFLECLLEHKMHFLLSTKAYVSKDHIRRLIDAGFTKKVRGVIQRQVQLSIDAADENVTKRVLRVSYGRTRQNVQTVQNFLDFGIMPKIKAVITGLNYDQPRPIVELFYPLGARVFHFVRYRRSFHRHDDNLFLTPQHLAIVRNQFADIAHLYPDVRLVENLTQEHLTPADISRESRQLLWNGRLGCGGGWSSLGISADGKAFLCEQMTMADPFYIGDATCDSIEAIWHSERLLGFIYPERTPFRETICYDCEDFDQCMWEKGRCYRDAYFSYGSIYYPPPLCPKNDRPGLRMS